MNQILKRFEDKTAIIGIVGLGYVGFPLALRFSEERYKVIGFDVDEVKICKINSSTSFISHIKNSDVQKAVFQGLVATSNFERIQEVDVIILCLPTPLNANREPDLSFITNTMNTIYPHLRANQILSLESTTYPGTTDEELRPIIEKRGFTLGSDYFLVFSPEREDQGNAHFTTRTIPKVVGGCTHFCLKVGVALYSQVVDQVVTVSSTKVAEMTKLLENIHRAVNIGLINELKVVCDKMGIDIQEVIDAASTKPFGFVPYRPGPGVGGHCIPIDPLYLTWKAKEFGVDTKFIELAGAVNSSMPNYVFEKISLALNKRQIKVKNAHILICGIAYKKNIDDTRESPALVLMEKLRSEGAHISYSDPHVPDFTKIGEHQFNLTSVDINLGNLTTYDCVVLITDHDKFDYDLLLKHSKLIIDTRGKFRGVFSNVVSA